MLTIVLRPPGSGARAAAAALAAAVVLTADGCAGFSKAFGQQEAVVQFRPGTPKSTRLQVRSACSRIPQVKPEPLPSASLASAQLYDVRYEVGGASDAHLAELQQCLQRFPSVLGVDVQTPGG
jgi:hypothetical protein